VEVGAPNVEIEVAPERKPFVDVNCAAFNREGERENLFLDEIGDLSQRSKAMLLRVLQERKLERVGETEAIKIDVRLVAATNHDLRREVDEGHFRRAL
jgi:transcriptional regulator with GAF, ATPase, and Fis domain